MASSEAMTTSCAWPPDSRRGSRSASAPMSSSRQRGLGASHGLASREAQVHRPERDLLEDGAGHARTVAWRGSGRRSRHGSRTRAAACRPSTRHRWRQCRSGRRRSSAGASPDATRHSVDLPASFGPDDPHDLAVGQRQVDVVEDGPRVARVAVRDPVRSASALDRPAMRRPTDDHEQRDEQPSGGDAPRRCRPSSTAGGASPAG